jgi:hypothetical protein
MTAEERPTLCELVEHVIECNRRRRAQGLDAQRRMLAARIQRDSQIPGLERDVASLRRKLEALG